MTERRDPHTGYMTIGHEWGEITELNRPVPTLVWFFLLATILFSLVYWVLMPAWPLANSYTKGVLGANQRVAVTEDIQRANVQRADWARRIETSDVAAVQSDASLMQVVRAAGRTLFKDNCAVCHGMEGQGQTGYPRLTDSNWIWGGSPAAVAETIRVGINASHDETRISEMLAFGRDGLLNREDVLNVVDYVRSLSQMADADAEAGKISAGREVFADQCSACHGSNGKGNTELGAPNLADNIWIYGGDRQSVYMSVYHGRRGEMPAWDQRLSTLERKILTLFVLDLGGRGRAQ